MLPGMTFERLLIELHSMALELYARLSFKEMAVLKTRTKGQLPSTTRNSILFAGASLEAPGMCAKSTARIHTFKSKPLLHLLWKDFHSSGRNNRRLW